jgi:hypothetical protein
MHEGQRARQVQDRQGKRHIEIDAALKSFREQHQHEHCDDTSHFKRHEAIHDGTAQAHDTTRNQPDNKAPAAISQIFI